MTKITTQPWRLAIKSKGKYIRLL